jgi:uncharacterized protein (DUF1501 family)
MAHVNAGSPLSMNVSLSGVNTFQTGSSTVTFVTSPAGAPQILSYQDPVEKVAVDTMLEAQYKSLYESTFSGNTRKSFDTNLAFGAAIQGISAPNPNPPFPNTNLASQLKMIARIIASRTNLSMKRQVFFVLLGGWDHHTEVLNSQQALLSDVDGALGAFWGSLGLLGVQNNVTLYTASDFGRTLTSNGRGTDHAWGGNQIVMGGAVNGGRIVGQYPSLALGTGIDTGRGRLIPTTSVDLYSAELAAWFGVPASEMATVLPNIGNFIDPMTTRFPLGLLGS